jgi:protein ImuA
MNGLQKKQSLIELKARIAALENRPVLAESAVLARQDGVAEDDILAVPAGLLHEVFTNEQRNAGAALGFAFGHAGRLLNIERPAMLYLQLGHEAQEFGLPYGAGLASFGLDPKTVILGRMQSMAELLWAMEEAVSCRAVAAVVADIGSHHKALDFTASRRLSLKAASAGASILILRYGLEREASAARLRWHVMPATSGIMAFDARAPGEARWLARLEKGYFAQEREGLDRGWLLGWKENGFYRIEDRDDGAERAVSGAAPHGAAFAALGYRLSQTA